MHAGFHVLSTLPDFIEIFDCHGCHELYHGGSGFYGVDVCLNNGWFGVVGKIRVVLVDLAAAVAHDSSEGGLFVHLSPALALHDYEGVISELYCYPSRGKREGFDAEMAPKSKALLTASWSIRVTLTSTKTYNT